MYAYVCIVNLAINHIYLKYACPQLKEERNNVRTLFMYT